MCAKWYIVIFEPIPLINGKAISHRSQDHRTAKLLLGVWIQPSDQCVQKLATSASCTSKIFTDWDFSPLETSYSNFPDSLPVLYIINMPKFQSAHTQPDLTFSVHVSMCLCNFLSPTIPSQCIGHKLYGIPSTREKYGSRSQKMEILGVHLSHTHGNRNYTDNM